MTPALLNERISFGGLASRGFALAAEIPAPTLINVGDVWQFDFISDKPISPQQFFALVESFQQELDGKGATISFAPLDQTHFRLITKALKPGAYHGPGDTEIMDIRDGSGPVRFTLIDGKPYVETAPTTLDQGLSTGAVVGLTAAGATVLGTVIYLATRKPKRRRRR